MRLGCSTECYMRRRIELLGLLVPALAFLFPSCLRGIPGNAGPRSLAIPGSSSRELRLLFRVDYCFKPVHRPQPTYAFLGVFVAFFAI